jgi:hypothetical protein
MGRTGCPERPVRLLSLGHLTRLAPGRGSADRTCFGHINPGGYSRFASSPPDIRDGKILALNAKWFIVSNSNYYCPGYIPRARQNQPPRDLLLSALALPEGKFVPLPKQKDLFEAGDDTEMVASRVNIST